MNHHVHQYKCDTVIWLYPGNSGWYFCTIPPDLGKKIKSIHGYIRRGFGSIPVTAIIGKTRWDTSIFPDSQAGSYLLPVKKLVRQHENLSDRSTVSLTLEIRE